MKDKIFEKIIMIISACGITSVIAITVWTIYLYRHCSIITFIANGG